jgi:hypothetical protein
MFQRNILPSSSESKSKPSKEISTSWCQAEELYPLLLWAISDFLFHWLPHSSVQAWTGLYKAWFSMHCSLCLLPDSVGSLPGFVFNHEDGGDIFLQNLRLSLNYTVPQHTRAYSTCHIYFVFLYGLLDDIFNSPDHNNMIQLSLNNELRRV